MIIILHRKVYADHYTAGELWIDGIYFSDTLEPSRDKPIHEGHPCIPIGTYRISITYSHRLKKLLPLISNVPGRDGIRIHAFNRASESHGCIGLGSLEQSGAVLERSLIAVSQFQRLLGSRLRKEPVTFEVMNA